MKFEQLLMQRSEDQHNKRLALEEEVEKLHAELEGEETLRNVLQYALDGPLPSRPPCLSSSLPPHVQVLLSELVMVEEEIHLLERKIDELKLQVYQERVEVREWEIRQQKRLVHQNNSNNLLCEAAIRRSVLDDQRSRSQNYEVLRKERFVTGNGGDRRPSLSSASDHIRSLSSTASNREIVGRRRANRGKVDNASSSSSSGIVKPNEVSEELVKCLIGIFLELNQTSVDKEAGSLVLPNNVPKMTLSCMNSKGFIGKTSLISCKYSPTFLFDSNSADFDPYGTFSDHHLDASTRDVGPYKNFIQIITSSLDITRFSQCSMGIRKLRVLMHKLCDLDLTFLTYKQKLAFWINIYNACIMHAFLEHGLPSTQEKLLALMNKATLDVGGIVLNALAIEHFILRYPLESNHKIPSYEKEMLLRHAYGLGYPEPNVTFALCRGTWSSPALRVYTPDNIANEMERAKVEYLEASVGVTSRKKIVVPKLLQWHMLDFADDMESLLEWIYSQLPRSGSLKRQIMECLNGETKSPINKMVEVQPYESEFRYLLPSVGFSCDK